MKNFVILIILIFITLSSCSVYPDDSLTKEQQIETLSLLKSSEYYTTDTLVVYLPTLNSKRTNVYVVLKDKTLVATTPIKDCWVVVNGFFFIISITCITITSFIGVSVLLSDD